MNKKNLISTIATTSLLASGCASRIPMENSMANQARDNHYVEMQGPSIDYEKPEEFKVPRLQYTPNGFKAVIPNGELDLENSEDILKTVLSEKVPDEIKTFINENYGSQEHRETEELEFDQFKDFAYGSLNNEGKLNLPANGNNYFSAYKVGGEIVAVQMTPGIDPEKVATSQEDLEGKLYGPHEVNDNSTKFWKTSELVNSWDITEQTDSLNYIMEVADSKMTSLHTWLPEAYFTAHREENKDKKREALLGTLTTMYTENPKLAQDLLWGEITRYKTHLGNIKMQGYKLDANIKDLSGFTFWTAVFAGGTTHKLISEKDALCKVSSSSGSANISGNAVEGVSSGSGGATVVGSLISIYKPNGC